MHQHECRECDIAYTYKLYILYCTKSIYANISCKFIFSPSSFLALLIPFSDGESAHNNNRIRFTFNITQNACACVCVWCMCYFCSPSLYLYALEFAYTIIQSHIREYLLMCIVCVYCVCRSILKKYCTVHVRVLCAVTVNE